MDLAREALRKHWPEYAMEAGCVAILMIAACIAGVLLEHPSSILVETIENPVLRRVARGMVMGLVAIVIVCSPWGRRAGGHMNPAITFTYWMLGKIAGWDALFYVAAQFAGGVAGVAAAMAFVGLPLRHAAVNYMVTTPGPDGAMVAFAAELAISLTTMAALLWVSNSARFTRLTPYVAGALVASFISIESPFSGSSMNPARTLGSAFAANEWTALWVYFAAPLAGMAMAAVWYRLRRGADGVYCAKLHHWNDERCIFHCRFSELV